MLILALILSGLSVTSALEISWRTVTQDRRGGVENQPVTYLVPFAIGEMAPRSGDDPTTPWPDDCLPDGETGAVQECASWTLSEWDVGEATSFTVPDPPLGQVYMVTDPIAVDPARNRSDRCSP